jgi:hypothetical protein
MLLVAHGTALSMMHTKKIIKNASRFQLNKRALSTGLSDDVKDAAFLRNVSAPSDLMDAHNKELIRRAYIRSIYQVARVEAMCKIYGDTNLSQHQKIEILSQVPYVVKE